MTDPDDITHKPSLWGDQAVPFEPFEISSIIRSYHAMIAHLDDCLGRLITALEESGQLEDTVIVFSSDHGEFLGNHDRLFKGPYLCDDLLRVPMIIWDSAGRNTVKGKTDVLTSSLDFFPTFQTLAGIDTLTPSRGKPMLDRDFNLAPDGEHPFALSEWRKHPDKGSVDDEILSIRTRDYRYVYYANTGEEELYEHASDPYELRNRASDPSLSGRKQELGHLLEENSPPRGNWPAPTAPW